MAKQAGFTLMELVIAVVLMGALVLIGLPRMAATLEHNDVRGARTKVVALFNRCKAMAIETNRGANFHIQPTMVMITQALPGGGIDTVHVQDFGPSGVGLVGTRTMIVIDPRGVVTNLGTSTATIALSKGVYADTVLISGFGRVMTQ
ncbi:MAG: prepilin-type N-terminal cleavage/methylation domain-containing protein [Gemmatimonadales bacterium]